MVLHGRKRDEAAKSAELTDDALYRAMKKPEVLAYMNSQMGVLRTSAASRTIAKAEQLMDGATSEHVQLQALTWIGGLEGISPIAKSESVNVHKHLMPGLTIVYAPAMTPGDDARVIDSQARQSEDVKHISNLPPRVPHPSERNGQR